MCPVTRSRWPQDVPGRTTWCFKSSSWTRATLVLSLHLSRLELSKAHIFRAASVLHHYASWTTTLPLRSTCSETTRNPLLCAVVDRRLYTHIVVTNFKVPDLFYHADPFPIPLQ